MDPAGDPKMNSPSPIRDDPGRLAYLLEIMRRLRDPINGCAWDREQNFRTIAPFTVEEAFEVAEAIERSDMPDLCDELGDLLLQVVFHAQMAREINAFAFADVVEAIVAKMIRRHPHVFAVPQSHTAGDQSISWERSKEHERQHAGRARDSVLDGVPAALPAAMRAQKLQDRAAKIGFDWPSPLEVLAKIHEEAEEIAAEIDRGDKDRLEDEVGDLLFACVNLARHFGFDAEGALRRANRKFEARFRSMEARLKPRLAGPDRPSLEEMERAWQETKRGA
jgi:nucleoside triphosphate diphosphatase